MSNRGPSYGMSREIKMKLAAKYDTELEKKQRTWISQVTNIPIPEDMSFHELLKDGIILVSLSEALSPGIIKRPFPHLKLLNSFRCMENIQAFLEVCESFGLGQHSLFQTCDLYDGSNMTQVQTLISQLASVATSKGMTDVECDFAIKVSEKKVRKWTPEKMNAGQAIIGLQMGSNKGASQSGMSFGTSRPLYDKKYTGHGEHAPEMPKMENQSEQHE